MSEAPTLDRLAAALKPAPKFDRFDDMAITIMGEAAGHSFKDARELIAARLRLLHAESVGEGLELAREVIAS